MAVQHAWDLSYVDADEPRARIPSVLTDFIYRCRNELELGSVCALCATYTGVLTACVEWNLQRLEFPI